MTVVRSPVGRARAAWEAAHTPVADVPGWARAAAYAIPLTVLPSALWRFAALVLRLPSVEGMGEVPAWLPPWAYFTVLSIVSELLAVAAIGLVAEWGEVVPGWVPVLRGRRVPAAAAGVPAALGAAVLIVLWTYALGRGVLLGQTLTGGPLPRDYPLQFRDWTGAMSVLAYVPLLAWGPLLAAVTYAYFRRRARRPS